VQLSQCQLISIDWRVLGCPSWMHSGSCAQNVTPGDELFRRRSCEERQDKFAYPDIKCIEGKVILCFTDWVLRHDDLWGSGCIDLCFLDLGTSWRCGQLNALADLSKGRGLRHPCYSEPVWTIWRSGKSWMILPGTEPRTFGHPSRSQSLHRLHYTDSQSELQFMKYIWVLFFQTDVVIVILR
jgi:hypothetical protein